MPYQRLLIASPMHLARGGARVARVYDLIKHSRGHDILGLVVHSGEVVVKDVRLDPVINAPSTILDPEQKRQVEIKISAALRLPESMIN